MGKQMKSAERVEEYLWLVNNGVSPVLAVQQLERKPDTMSRLLYRQGFSEEAAELAKDAKWPGRVYRD